jgi:hypothetical protein
MRVLADWLDNTVARVSWRVWAGIALSAAILEYLSQITQPHSLYYYDGNIVYPWFVDVKPRVELVLAIIGIVSFIGLLHPRSSGVYPDSRTWLVLAFVALACIFSCGWGFISQFGASAIYPKETIFYQGNTYHLVEVYGLDPDGENSDYGTYRVYKCDNIGFWCHWYFQAAAEIYFPQPGDPPEAHRNAAFVIDSSDGRLFLQVGSEKSLVGYNLYGPEPDWP